MLKTRLLTRQDTDMPTIHRHADIIRVKNSIFQKTNYNQPCSPRDNCLHKVEQHYFLALSSNKHVLSAQNLEQISMNFVKIYGRKLTNS